MDEYVPSITACKASYTFGLVLQEVIDFGGRSVVGTDDEAFIIHIENEILSLCEIT
jgi:hypothetical protein